MKQNQVHISASETWLATCQNNHTMCSRHCEVCTSIQWFFLFSTDSNL